MTSYRKGDHELAERIGLTPPSVPFEPERTTMKTPPKLYELDEVSQKLIDAVPPLILEAINHYVWYGRKTGGFTECVLCNDLLGAIARADETSLAAIRPICMYVYNAVPSPCHGSREAVAAHLKAGRGLIETQALEN